MTADGWDLVVDGYDWRRLPFEITRAVEHETGVLVDQLTPGLAMTVEGDVAAIHEAGHGTICRIPMYRLRAIDDDLVASAIAAEDVGMVDQLAAAIRDRRLKVEDRPDRDVVVVWVAPDEGRSWHLHRCLCVPGWPWGED